MHTENLNTKTLRLRLRLHHPQKTSPAPPKTHKNCCALYFSLSFFSAPVFPFLCGWRWIKLPLFHSSSCCCWRNFCHGQFHELAYHLPKISTTHGTRKTGQRRTCLGTLHSGRIEWTILWFLYALRFDVIFLLTDCDCWWLPDRCSSSSFGKLDFWRFSMRHAHHFAEAVKWQIVMWNKRKWVWPPGNLSKLLISRLVILKGQSSNR